jgi:hypothetical protein
MPIWLEGAGRSDEDLARLVNESRVAGDTYSRNRRQHERHKLNDAHGHLIYEGSKTPCQVLEISLGGCSVLTEKAFRPGALASIEVVLPIFWMILHISGMTQWKIAPSRFGVQFTNMNNKSKIQLAGLIDCLLGKVTAESVMKTIASPVLNPVLGHVLAVQPPGAQLGRPDMPAGRPGKVPYDRLVHGGEGRLHTQKEGEWPVVLRAPDGRFSSTGTIVDLSLGGCTVRTTKPFTGEVQNALEVNFEIQGLHSLLCGVAQAIYDPETVGIHFAPMSRRKQEELEQLIEDLRAEGKTQLEVA